MQKTEAADDRNVTTRRAELHHFELLTPISGGHPIYMCGERIHWLSVRQSGTRTPLLPSLFSLPCHEGKFLSAQSPRSRTTTSEFEENKTMSGNIEFYELLWAADVKTKFFEQNNLPNTNACHSHCSNNSGSSGDDLDLYSGRGGRRNLHFSQSVPYPSDAISRELSRIKKNILTGHPAHKFYEATKQKLYGLMYRKLVEYSEQYVANLYLWLYLSCSKDPESPLAKATLPHIPSVIDELLCIYPSLARSFPKKAKRTKRRKLNDDKGTCHGAATSADGGVLLQCVQRTIPTLQTLKHNIADVNALTTIDPVSWLQPLLTLVLNMGSISSTLSFLFKLNCFENERDYPLFLLYTLPQLNPYAKNLLCHWVHVQAGRKQFFLNNFNNCDFLYCLIQYVGQQLLCENSSDDVVGDTFAWESCSHNRLFYNYCNVMAEFTIDTKTIEGYEFFLHYILDLHTLPNNEYLLFNNRGMTVVKDQKDLLKGLNEDYRCSLRMLSPYTVEGEQLDFLIFERPIGIRNEIFHLYEFATPALKSLPTLKGLPDIDYNTFNVLTYPSLNTLLFKKLAMMRCFLEYANWQALSTLLLCPTIDPPVLEAFQTQLDPHYQPIDYYYEDANRITLTDFMNVSFLRDPTTAAGHHHATEVEAQKRVIWNPQIFPTIKDYKLLTECLVWWLRIFASVEQTHNYNINSLTSFVFAFFGTESHEILGLPPFQGATNSCDENDLRGNVVFYAGIPGTEMPRTLTPSATEKSTQGADAAIVGHGEFFTATSYMGQSDKATKFIQYLKAQNIMGKNMKHLEQQARKLLRHSLASRQRTAVVETRAVDTRNSLTTPPAAAAAAAAKSSSAVEQVATGNADYVMKLRVPNRSQTLDQSALLDFLMRVDAKSDTGGGISVDLSKQPVEVLQFLLGLASWTLRMATSHPYKCTPIFRWINRERAHIYAELRDLLETHNGTPLRHSSLKEMSRLIKQFDQYTSVDFSHIPAQQIASIASTPLIDVTDLKLAGMPLQPTGTKRLACFCLDDDEDEDDDDHDDGKVTNIRDRAVLSRSPMNTAVNIRALEGYQRYAEKRLMDQYSDSIYDALASLAVHSEMSFDRLIDLLKMIMTLLIKGNVNRVYYALIGLPNAGKSLLAFALGKMLATDVSCIVNQRFFSTATQQEYDGSVRAAAFNLMIHGDDVPRISLRQTRLLANTATNTTRAIRAATASHFRLCATPVVTSNNNLAGDGAVLDRVRPFVKTFSFTDIASPMPPRHNTSADLKCCTPTLGYQILIRRLPHYVAQNELSGLWILVNLLMPYFFHAHTNPISPKLSVSGAQLHEQYVIHNYPVLNFFKNHHIKPSNTNHMTQSELYVLVENWWNANKFKFNLTSELTFAMIWNDIRDRCDMYRTPAASDAHVRYAMVIVTAPASPKFNPHSKPPTA